MKLMLILILHHYIDDVWCCMMINSRYNYSILTILYHRNTIIIQTLDKSAGIRMMKCLMNVLNYWWNILIDWWNCYCININVEIFLSIDEIATVSILMSKYFDQLMKLLWYQYKCQLMMVDALWKIEWGVCFTDNCCNDNDDQVIDSGLMYWWKIEYVTLRLSRYTIIIDIQVGILMIRSYYLMTLL